MILRRTLFLLSLACVALAAGRASAWRARVYDRYQKIPIVVTREAEDLAANAAADKFASGGRAVALRADAGELNLSVALDEGYYSIWLYARAPGAAWDDWSAPVYVEMNVTAPDDRVERSHARVAYLPIYQDVARLYVRAYAKGEYRIALRLGAASKRDLLCDFVEVRDEMPGCERRAIKTKRTLVTDEEIIRRRTRALAAPPRRRQAPTPAAAEELERVVDETINKLPPLNATWDEGNLRAPQAALDAALKDFEDTGDITSGRLAAMLLALMADRLPTFDGRVQNPVGMTGKFAFTRFGRLDGTGLDSTDLARAYDALFDLIVADGELAAFVGRRIPWVHTPRDLVAFLDYTILQHGLVQHFRFEVQGMQTGWEQDVVALITALGVNEASQRWLDRFMREGYADLSGNAGWLDHLVCGMNRDGVNIVGGTEYTKAVPDGVVIIARALRDYAANGGRVPRYTYDPAANPRILDGLRWLLEYTTAGGWSSYLGEYSGTTEQRSCYRPTYSYWRLAPTLAQAFDWTGDPRYAALAVAYGKADLSDADWARLTQAAAGTRTPLLAKTSTVQPGFGATMLEMGSASDDFTQKGSVLLRHGSGRGHAHGDLLNISLHAYGYRVVPDGGRGWFFWPRFTSQHASLEVDRSSFQATDANSGAYGWNTLFKPLPGCQVAGAAGWCSNHPDLNDFRRDVAMIATGPRDYYVFDVIRADGGKVHTYCFHGPVSDEYGTNAGERPTTDDPRGLMYGGKDWMSGTAVDPLIYTAKLRPSLSGKDEVYVRQWAFGFGGQPFWLARATGAYNRDTPFLWVERASDKPLADAYPAVTEPYLGTSKIRSVRRLGLAAFMAIARRAVPGEPLDKPAAVEVVTVDGRTDTIVSQRNGLLRGVRTETGVETDGRFAMVSVDGDGVAQAVLIGGTFLRRGAFELKAAQGEHAGKIASADLETGKITLDTAFPADVAGEQVQLGRAPHCVSDEVAAVDGRTLTLRRRPIIYRSPIVRVATDERAVYPEIQMPWTAAEPRYYDGCTASNESHSRTWRVRVEPVEMWMPLFTPIHEADITDADGDGRRTVRLTRFSPPENTPDPVIRFYGPFVKPVRWAQANRAPFVEPVVLDVTRVNEKERRLYFKPPVDYDLRWFRFVYNGVEIANESGTRAWRGEFPATDFRIVLDGGAPPTAADFTDADGDGRATILLYDYGPADVVRLDTHAQARRVAPGKYDLTSDTPATIGNSGDKVIK